MTTTRGNQSEQTSKLKEELSGPLRVMQEAARRIAKIAIESKLPLVEGEERRTPNLSSSNERERVKLTSTLPCFLSFLLSFFLSFFFSRRRICRVVQTRVDGRRVQLVQWCEILGHLQGELSLSLSLASFLLSDCSESQTPPKSDFFVNQCGHAMQMTDVFEGSLIRVFRRLQELIRQMSMGESLF